MASSSLKISISNVLNQSISQIQKSTPLAVGLLLSSAALLPTIQTAPAELAAGLAIGGTLLSGLGTNLITDLIKEKLYKLAGKKDEEILKETEKALLKLWNESGKKGEDFRKELSAFLQRNGILQMAMDGAPQETKNALLSSFAELAEKFDEFNWALKYIQESLAEISATGRQQVETSNEILAKVNLLLQMQRENQKKAPLSLEPKQGEEDQQRTEIKNPYKGLAFFTQADGNTYFGREELTAQLLAKLAGPPFLALLGASGSGKSSLMRAGVIWALYVGGIPGSENWKVLVMRPGATPLEDLAAQVSAESRSVSSSLMREIKTDPSALRLEAKKILLNLSDDAKLVLAVDQFEEVFTQCQDENERGQFIAALTDAAQHSNSRIVVLLTLRADYYGRCSAYPVLAKLLSENQVLVGEMTDTELRRAISAPAENVGVRVEAGLPELIIEEARGEKGALPMISLALAELFKNRKTDTLKVAEYRELGGLNQVIATTADKAYLSLSQAEQTLAQKILLDLVKTGETAEQDARQRVRPSALASGNKNRIQVEELLNKLADARLIVKDGESEDAQVEVAHEALFRHWDKLRNWLEEAREEKNLRQKISEAANEWIQNNKDANLLIHRGGRLDDALKLDDLNPTDLEYIKAGDALRRKEQRDRERRTQITIFASIAAAVVFLVLGAFGLVKSNEATNQAATARANASTAATAQANAEDQVKISLARQLAAQANSIEFDDQLSLLLATKSMQIWENTLASQVIQNNTAPHIVYERDFDRGNVNIVSFSPDGKRLLVVGGQRGELHLLESNSGNEIVSIGFDIISAAFSPDGKYIATESGESLISIWNGATGEPIRNIYSDGPVNTVLYSPSGNLIASIVNGNSIHIWDVDTGDRVFKSQEMNGVRCLRFSPDGKYISSGGEDHLVHIWEVLSGLEVFVASHDGSVNAVAFNANGDYIVSGGDDHLVKIWNVQTSELIHSYSLAGSVKIIEFSHGTDNKFLASGQDGSVWVLDFSGQRFSITVHEHVVRESEFSPNDYYVISGSWDGSAHIWEANTGKEVVQVKTGWSTESVAFSPDGNLAAAVGCSSIGGFEYAVCIEGTLLVFQVTTGIDDFTYDKDSLSENLIQGVDIKSSVYDESSNTMFLGGIDGAIRSYEMQIGKETIFASHMSSVLSLALSPDGRYLISGGEDRTVKVWDVTTGKEIAQASFPHEIYSVEFTPDGIHAIYDGKAGGKYYWEVFSGKIISNWREVDDVVFSANGNYLALVYKNKAGVDVMNAETGTTLFHINTVPESVFWRDGFFVAFSLDEKTLIISEEDDFEVWNLKTKDVNRFIYPVEYKILDLSSNAEFAVLSNETQVMLWNLISNKEIATLGEHKDGTLFFFRGKEPYVVSVGCEKITLNGKTCLDYVNIWDTKTGLKLTQMLYDGTISDVSFSLDEKYIIIYLREYTNPKKVLWQPNDLMLNACSRLNRNLSSLEWQQYIGSILPYQTVCPSLPLEPEDAPTP